MIAVADSAFLWTISKEPPSRVPLPPVVELWVAVIMVAMSDARLRDGRGGWYEKRRSRLVREEARAFLRGDWPSLRHILTALDIDASWWLARVLPSLEAQWRAADAGTSQELRPGPHRLIGFRGRPRLSTAA